MIEGLQWDACISDLHSYGAQLCVHCGRAPKISVVCMLSHEINYYIVLFLKRLWGLFLCNFAVLRPLANHRMVLDVQTMPYNVHNLPQESAAI